MKNIYCLLLFLPFLITGNGFAQSSFIPRNMGDNVNTTYDEINPVVSADGKALYFTRVNHPENKYGAHDSQDIWFSELQEDGTWSLAKHLPAPLNVGRYNGVMAVSGDGNSLLIFGIYNNTGKIWKKRGYSMVTKTGDTWGVPKKVNIKGYSRNNKGLYSNASMSFDGKIMLLSYSKRYNGNNINIFYSEPKKNGEWKKPRKINSLNTKYLDHSPFYATDNYTLYFTSDRDGSSDIYQSTRYNDKWSDWAEPKKCSDTINSNQYEGYFRTNQKGSWGFFASTNNSKGGADLFSVKLYEDNPFIIVSGKVINATTDQPVSPDVIYSVVSDSLKIDSLEIDPANSSYIAKLPLGKFYRIAASAENFTSKVDTVDASEIKEFTELTKDLYITPIPYVTVSGKLVVKSTSEIIPELADPKIAIDGVILDSAKIDYRTGTYTINLNYGKAYNIQVVAKGYEPEADQINLSAVKKYQKISQNLYVDVKRVATITGKIFDKKTGKPFAPGIPLKIMVNESSAVAVIDSASASYEVKLPLGSNYTINAAAANYYPVYEIVDVHNERSNIRIYKDLFLVPIEVGQSIRLNNIFFETGKSSLKSESFPELNRVVEFMKNNPNIKIEIAGHTDNVGKAASNMNLSVARAKAVAEYLVKQGGIPKEMITHKGYGMTKPVADNKTTLGKSLNRRVEFTILDK